MRLLCFLESASEVMKRFRESLLKRAAKKDLDWSLCLGHVVRKFNREMRKEE